MYRIRIGPDCILTEMLSFSPKRPGPPELRSVVAAKHRFSEEPVKMEAGTTQPLLGSQLPQQEISLTC